MNIALLLTLGSSACWAGLDAMRKRLAGKLSAIALVVWLSLLQAPLFGAWWAAIGGTLETQHIAGYVGIAALALVLNVIANVAFVRAVHISDLSTTIPMMAFSPVFTAAVANPVLGERPEMSAILGILAVVVGALFLTFRPPSSATDGDEGPPSTPGSPLRWFAARFRDQGALLMLLVAACWSTTTVLDKIATRHAPLPMHGLVINTGVGLSLAAFLWARGRASELADVREDLPGMGVAALLGAGALGLQLAAIQGMLVGLVETIKRAFGMLSSIVVGRVAWGEAITPTKVVGALLMAAGTAAILIF